MLKNHVLASNISAKYTVGQILGFNQLNKCIFQMTYLLRKKKTNFMLENDIGWLN